MTGRRIGFWAGMAAVCALTSAAEPDISQLGWLQGCWTGTKDGVAMQEQWTSPAGGALVGMHKDVKDGAMISFEFLRIAPQPGKGICYLASPKGAPPTPFCARELGERRVVFENREHDFPQRTLYWLDGDGSLHARIEGPMQGQEISEEWAWRKTPDC
jgi:Domain of unknown function (DUF6265)